MGNYKNYSFSDPQYNGTTITNMIEHYWSNISNGTYGMASFLNSSNAFAGTFYKHDSNNGFIIFSGQSPSYKTQKGIMMNGNWTWVSLISNSDLQFTYINKIKFENFKSRLLIYAYTDSSLQTGYRVDFDLLEKYIQICPLENGQAVVSGGFTIKSSQ